MCSRVRPFGDLRLSRPACLLFRSNRRLASLEVPLGQRDLLEFVLLLLQGRTQHDFVRVVRWSAQVVQRPRWHCSTRKAAIQRSKKRISEIHRHRMKLHQIIISPVKRTSNTYLQQRRQYENDRLCAMIIKHQNRQSAKIYGDLVRHRLYKNWTDNNFLLFFRYGLF